MHTAPPSRAARVFAWTGAGLFLASLTYFLYAYFVAFGRPAGATAAVPAVLWNAVLFTGFAAHHSVFARTPVRDWVSRIATGLERSTYVWIASVLFIAVCALWQSVPGEAWHVSGAGAGLLHGLQLAGAWLTVRGASAVDALDLAGIRQLGTRRAPTEFIVTGPYGWMRHPIYSGWMLVVFCHPVMNGTRLTFAVLSSVYLLAAIPWEERTLERTSHGAYGRYKERVRWKLVPFVY